MSLPEIGIVNIVLLMPGKVANKSKKLYSVLIVCPLYSMSHKIDQSVLKTILWMNRIPSSNNRLLKKPIRFRNKIIDEKKH